MDTITRRLSMLKFGLLTVCLWQLGPGIASALPGQSVSEVKTWMQAHPTLRAQSQERLRVHRVETPARRFTFQASVFPIGGLQTSSGLRLSDPPQLNTIRREEFTLVDYSSPVDRERLEAALRVIYGAEIHADYQRASLVVSYPDDGLGPGPRGAVWAGERYAYWTETVPDETGFISIGKLNLLPIEDISRLQSYLQRQSAASAEF